MDDLLVDHGEHIKESDSTLWKKEGGTQFFVIDVIGENKRAKIDLTII